MSEIKEHENYVRLGNLHIFVNFYDHNMEDIEAIKDKDSQEIHLFPTSISMGDEFTATRRFIITYHDKLKIVVHTYKRHATWLTDFFKLNFEGCKCKITCEGEGPTFVRDDKIIDVLYTDEGVVITKRLTSCQWAYFDKEVPNMKGDIKKFK